MALGFQFDTLQAAINRAIRDSIVKDGIASGEFTAQSHPELFSTSQTANSFSADTSHHSLGTALAGAAAVAVGSLLMNWLSSKQTKANIKPEISDK